MHKLILAAACILATGAVFAFANQPNEPAKAPPAAVKWEYKTLRDDKPDLNKLGDEGWELVTVVPERIDTTRGEFTERRQPKVFYLKRAK
jgi:hypothetical protein